MTRLMTGLKTQGSSAFPIDTLPRSAASSPLYVMRGLATLDLLPMSVYANSSHSVCACCDSTQPRCRAEHQTLVASLDAARS